ncbi:hypothetical protein KI387_009473, partial [Taxus chinensis]
MLLAHKDMQQGNFVWIALSSPRKSLQYAVYGKATGLAGPMSVNIHAKRGSGFFHGMIAYNLNFDDVLVPPDHVSRSYNDTYYINSETVLRCHTSAHQAELLREGYSHFLVTGDVYRRDSINATHYPVFHQMEGFRVFSPAEWESSGVDGTSYAAMDLKRNLEGLARHLFGNVEMQWVDTYFPFTNPSFELEIYFQGKWMEVLGCGVTEQAILNSNGRPGTTAWAFGLGLERLAMVLFDIPDIRLFWSSDHRFTSQLVIMGAHNFKRAIPIFRAVLAKCSASDQLGRPDLNIKFHDFGNPTGSFITTFSSHDVVSNAQMNDEGHESVVGKEMFEYLQGLEDFESLLHNEAIPNFIILECLAGKCDGLLKVLLIPLVGESFIREKVCRRRLQGSDDKKAQTHWLYGSPKRPLEVMHTRAFEALTGSDNGIPHRLVIRFWITYFEGLSLKTSCEWMKIIFEGDGLVHTSNEKYIFIRSDIGVSDDVMYNNLMINFGLVRLTPSKDLLVKKNFTVFCLEMRETISYHNYVVVIIFVEVDVNGICHKHRVAILEIIGGFGELRYFIAFEVNGSDKVVKKRRFLGKVTEFMMLARSLRMASSLSNI